MNKTTKRKEKLYQINNLIMWKMVSQIDISIQITILYLCLVWWNLYTIYFAGVPCSENIIVVGASLTVPSDPHERDIITYQCVTGFESSSGSGGSISCQSNGTWSAPSDPCHSKFHMYVIVCSGRSTMKLWKLMLQGP